MSASIRPTFLPIRASATARLAATVDLPTPPLPLPIGDDRPLAAFSAVIAIRVSATPGTRDRRGADLALERGALLGGEAGRVEHDRRDLPSFSRAIAIRPARLAHARPVLRPIGVTSRRSSPRR